MMQLSVHMMEAHNFKYDGSGRQYAVEPDQESLALKGKLKLMSSIKVHSRVSGLDWIRRNQNIRILYKFPDPIKKSGSHQNIRNPSKYPEPIKISGSNFNIQIQSKHPKSIKISGSNQNIRIQ